MAYLGRGYGSCRLGQHRVIFPNKWMSCKIVKGCKSPDEHAAVICPVAVAPLGIRFDTRDNLGLNEAVTPENKQIRSTGHEKRPVRRVFC